MGGRYARGKPSELPVPAQVDVCRKSISQGAAVKRQQRQDKLAAVKHSKKQRRQATEFTLHTYILSRIVHVRMVAAVKNDATLQSS